MGSPTPEIRDRMMTGEKFDCPSCGRTVSANGYSMTASLAEQVVMLYYAGRPLSNTELRPTNEGKWIQYGLLRHWGLAHVDNHMWSITALGRSFVRGECSIPKIVFVYDSECVGQTDSRRIMIDDCGVDFTPYAAIRPSALASLNPPIRRRATRCT